MSDPHLPTILSPEGSAEVEEELKNGSPMTPERRAMFERMRQREGVRRRSGTVRRRPGDEMNPYRMTPPLTPEGAAEIIAEMESPPADTPQRRATFARARAMAAVRERLTREEAAARQP